MLLYRDMKKIAILREKDIFGHEKNQILDETGLELRNTVKIIAMHEGKICVVGNSISHLYMLPGGGVDKDETLEDAAIRESLEEAGIRLDIQKRVGVIEDFRIRDKRRYLNYCYFGTVNELLEPQLTKEEAENGLHHLWLDKGEIERLFHFQMQLVKNGVVKYYNTCFNIVRDQLFLKNFYEDNFTDWR